jgi:hypothetical protein
MSIGRGYFLFLRAFGGIVPLTGQLLLVGAQQEAVLLVSAQAALLGAALDHFGVEGHGVSSPLKISFHLDDYGILYVLLKDNFQILPLSKVFQHHEGYRADLIGQNSCAETAANK